MMVYIFASHLTTRKGLVAFDKIYIIFHRMNMTGSRELQLGTGREMIYFYALRRNKTGYSAESCLACTISNGNIPPCPITYGIKQVYTPNTIYNFLTTVRDPVPTRWIGTRQHIIRDRVPPCPIQQDMITPAKTP